MAPVEFEKHIREKFEERRIDPSTDSWNKIAEQLESRPLGRKPLFSWYSIAATVAGILLAVTWFFNSEGNIAVESDAVVESPGVEEQETSPASKLPEIEKSEAVVVTDVEENSTNEMLQPESVELAVVQQEAVADNRERRSALEPVTVEQDLIIDNKISEIVAQVSLIELDSEGVTDAEVDSLLTSAQRELLADKNFRQGSAVDANLLLADVEVELDKSFRDQVFDKLKQGFIKVRTAVADRNK